MVKNRKFEKDPPIIGTRHLQCFLCFCCLSLSYALRVNLSVAIVAMTDVNSTRTDFEAYGWGESTKQALMSSFFWGYICTQIPGGMIAERYGGKNPLLYGVTLCSALALLTPLAVKYGGWQLLLVVRVLQGLLQGPVHPATHAMLARWAPVEERGTLGTIVYSGSQFGTIIMLAVSGLIADSSAGWPGIFYFSGGLGFLWALLWSLLASSTPADHRSISIDEKKFIENSIGQSESTKDKPSIPTPWRKIFTSKPFLSLMIVHCTHMFGFWTLLTQIPTYMKEILHENIKDSALLSSLPYLGMYLFSFFFIYLSKVLARCKGISLTFSRKFFNTVGHWIPMVSLIALGYVSTSLWTVVLLTITVAISGATYLGFQVNHIDLSPNFAGTLMGITNGAANVMSAFAPLVVSAVVSDKTNVIQWRVVFFIAAGFYFFGNLLFVIFGKTNVQSWNSPDDALGKRYSRALDAEAAPPLLLNGEKGLSEMTATTNSNGNGTIKSGS